jgi:hypothetical protein
MRPSFPRGGDEEVLAQFLHNDAKLLAVVACQSWRIDWTWVVLVKAASVVTSRCLVRGPAPLRNWHLGALRWREIWRGIARQLGCCSRAILPAQGSRIRYAGNYPRRCSQLEKNNPIGVCSKYMTSVFCRIHGIDFSWSSRPSFVWRQWPKK